MTRHEAQDLNEYLAETRVPSIPEGFDGLRRLPDGEWVAIKVAHGVVVSSTNLTSVLARGKV